jgi:protease-4
MNVMFSRRHPYLFSFLVLCTLVTVSVVSILVLVTTTMKRAGLSDLVIEPGDGKVGVVEIQGIITESKDIIRLIKRFRENDDIKSIVIRIDSPGGVIGPSQEIYREIRKTTQVKKIIASMGSIAASGGYYIAAATNGIVANPGTITGSIGVIMAYTNFRKVLDKIGMVPVVIKSGPFKDMGSPTKDMSKQEKEVLQAFVDQAHRQFVTAIAEGRNMNIDRVKSLADGRIYTGEEAVKQGLVDRLGNFEDAIEWAGEMGGIQGSVSTVYKKKEKFSFLKYVMESSLHDLINRVTRQDIFGGYLYSPASE